MLQNEFVRDPISLCTDDKDRVDDALIVCLVGILIT